jgi:hypothetical protein
MKYLPIQLVQNETPQKTEVQALSFCSTSFGIDQDIIRARRTNFVDSGRGRVDGDDMRGSSLIIFFLTIIKGCFAPGIAHSLVFR